MSSSGNLEIFWASLLSEDAGRIRRAWGKLTDEEAAAVLPHLKKMAADEGYSLDQRRAAQVALEAIRETG